MASKAAIQAADLLDKRAILELEKLEQVLEEITATEKELIETTIQLGKITKKTSKEAVERQEKVLAVTKKLNTVKTRAINQQLKHNKTVVTANKIRKKEEVGIKSLTQKWNAFQLAVTKAVAAYAAIMVFINAFNRLKETVITLDSFNVLMGKVTGNLYEAADSMDYLIDISKRFGISLQESTQRYSKFFAAARQSGLTTEETRKIFSSMAKTSGILSLRAEELRGVFLALEQMLSKGKVTTEELRRQLGERLPGAFGIMARAVGVTTSELDSMLKKGEVISKDILPKFAEEMEKAFGIEQTERVETLVAAIERAGTAYFELIREIEKSGAISDTIKSLYGAWTGYLEGFTQAVKDSKNENNKWYESVLLVTSGVFGLSGFIKLNEGVRQDQVELEKRNLAMQEWLKLVKGDIIEMDNLTRAQQDAILQSGEWTEAEIRRMEAMHDLSEVEQAVLAFQRLFLKARQSNIGLLEEEINLMVLKNKQQIAESALIENTVAWYEYKIKIAREELKTKIELEDAFSKEAIALRKNIKLYQEYINTILGKKDKEKVITDGPLSGLLDIQVAVEGSIDWYKEQITGIEGALRAMSEEELKRAFTLKEQLATYKKQQKVLEDSLTIVERIRDDEDEFDSGIAVGDALRGQQGGSLQGVLETGDQLQKWADEFVALDDDSRGTWDDFLSRKRDETSDIINASIELTNQMFDIGNALFDRRIENIQAEMDAIERSYDRKIELAQNDAEKQDDLEKEKQAKLEVLRKKELKERQKQAKLNKAQAIFNAGINVAVAIATMLTAGPGVGFVMAALAAAIGAASMATIIATPIPQYKEGRDGGKAEWAITGDGGVSEYIVGKKGIRKTPAEPTLTRLDSGDSVLKNDDAIKQMMLNTLLKGTGISFQPSDNKSIEDAVVNGFKKAKINNYIKMPSIKVDIDHMLWMHKKSQF